MMRVACSSSPCSTRQPRARPYAKMAQGRRQSRLRSLPASQAAQGPPSKRKLFKRTHELHKLDTMCKQAPVAIQVVLGPRSCGKTAVVAAYAADRQRSMYINMRTMDTSTPEPLLKALLQQLLSQVPLNIQVEVLDLLNASCPALVRALVAVLELSGQVDKRGGSAELSMRGLTPADLGGLDPAQEGHLGEVYVALRMLVEALEQHPAGAGADYQWPLIVIDEANALMPWSKRDPGKLMDLLRFFVAITKETPRCHVLLVTSEHAYLEWLNIAIGPSFCEPSVIGDFTQDDALEFLEQELRLRGSEVPVDSSSWDKVYQVCGGNAGALRRLASKVNEEFRGDWDNALRQVWDVEVRRVATLSYGGAGYTAAQYADAAVALLDAEDHVVATGALLVKLGRHVVGGAASKEETEAAGFPALQRLVEDYALGLRPYSDWAQDIPLEAFKEGEGVVTAPSAMDLYIMGRLRPRLDRTLLLWQQ